MTESTDTPQDEVAWEIPDDIEFDYDGIFNTLTLGDFEDIEDEADVAFSDIAKKNGIRMKALRAMMWVHLRKDQPGLPFEACRDIRIAQIVDGAEAGADDSPLEPSSEEE